MNTKTVCETLNISTKALRIYEALKIVVPKRDENNYRNYNDDDIMKLRQLILLKDMGIPLKTIKQLIIQESQKDNKIVRGLALQLKAVENRISELENIKNTLHESINDALATSAGYNYDQYFNRMTEILEQNQKERSRWMDKWGFDLWANTYDKSVYDDSDGTLNLFEKYDYVLDSVIKVLSAYNAEKIIDVGCGTGNLYSKMNTSVDYTGVDQSIEMLMQTKNKFPNVKLRLGNFLDELPYDGEFDAVVSTYAFHHLNSIEKEHSLRLLLKYLKPHGKIVIADLMFLNENEKLKQKEHFLKHGRSDLWNIIEDEYYTDIEALKKYAEFLGCKVQYKHIVNFTWIVEIYSQKDCSSII